MATQLDSPRAHPSMRVISRGLLTHATRGLIPACHISSAYGQEWILADGDDNDDSVFEAHGQDTHYEALKILEPQRKPLRPVPAKTRCGL